MAETIISKREDLIKDPVKSLNFLRRVLGEFHFPELDVEASSAIWERIKDEGLSPLNSGVSLHLHNDNYLIDGEEYQVLFEISGNSSGPVAIGKKTSYDWDKKIKEAEMNKPKAKIISVYLYGSTVYGLAAPWSDYDAIAVVDSKNDPSINSQVVEIVRNKYSLGRKKIDVNVYTEEEFVRGLEGLEISFLECVNGKRANSFDDTLIFGKKFEMPKIVLETLRCSISAKASNSWVKAKKKLTVEADYDHRIGTKSAWHALRILQYGIQLAETGEIGNIVVANGIYQEILQCEDWSELEKKFKPMYNHLSTEFRKVAPK